MAKLKFSVIGNPIKHSLSPEIHKYFASQFNLNDFVYEKIEATKENFKKNIETFFLNGGRGLNITIPFKVSAFKLCHSLDTSATLCGSVNTLISESNNIKGYNTDGIGFIDDLAQKEIEYSCSNILVIGAGGSSMSIISSLLQQSTESNIALLNRTKINADNLIAFFKNDRLTLHRSATDYNLVINTTPMSMYKEEIVLPKDIIDAKTICYDLFYSKTRTAFQSWAYDKGAKICHDGLGMLIQQAKHSFVIWNDLIPDVNNLEEKLREL